MRIRVRAKPGSKREFVKKVDTTTFIVAVKEPPVDGRANDAIIHALAVFFHIPEMSITLITGSTSRQKIIDILLTLEEIEKNKQLQLPVV